MRGERSHTALGSIRILAVEPEPEPEPGDAAAGLAPILRAAIAAGLITPGQARDVDALADGIAARMCSGELTEAQASALAHAQALRDGLAMRRARARRRGR